jgi:glycosyltransferase involved in cell wall biosynthesis
VSARPSVTVVVPTRNRPGLLIRTVDSLLAQESVDVHVLVIDDGSDPPAASRLPSDDRIRVLRNEAARGVAAARNRGAGEATTPWVAFCDDDDLWTPDKLAGQVRAAERSAARWAYTGAVKFAAGPVVWQVMTPPEVDEVRAHLADRNLVPAGASNVLVDRATFLAVGGFDEELAHLADWDLWLRLLADGSPARAPGLGVAYRLHPQAMSLNPDGILRELQVIDRRWRHLRGGRPLDPGPTHLWIAMSWLRAGRRWQAARSYAGRSHTGRGRACAASCAPYTRRRPARPTCSPAAGRTGRAGNAWTSCTSPRRCPHCSDRLRRAGLTEAVRVSGSATVSVVLIFYDDERFLPDAVAGVLAQSYDDWELVLADDGSTDGSSAFARRVAAEHPERVRYVDHPQHANRGPSATRNLGVRSSRGRYVAVLDSDDVWEPNKLAEQVAILGAHPEVGLVVGTSRYWWSWSDEPAPRADRLMPIGAPADRVHQPPTLALQLYPLGRGCRRARRPGCCGGN